MLPCETNSDRQAADQTDTPSFQTFTFNLSVKSINPPLHYRLMLESKLLPFVVIRWYPTLITCRTQDIMEHYLSPLVTPSLLVLTLYMQFYQSKYVCCLKYTVHVHHFNNTIFWENVNLCKNCK